MGVAFQISTLYSPISTLFQSLPQAPRIGETQPQNRRVVEREQRRAQGADEREVVAGVVQPAQQVNQVTNLFAPVVAAPGAGQERYARRAQRLLVVFEVRGGLEQQRDVSIRGRAPAARLEDQRLAPLDQLAQPLRQN